MKKEYDFCTSVQNMHTQKGKKMPVVTLRMNDKIYSKLMEFMDTFPKDSISIYEMDISESDITHIIGNQAVKEAQRKSLENGIPNVYSKNGVLYFQLPDGTITMDNPFEKGELKDRLDALTSAS